MNGGVAVHDSSVVGPSSESVVARRSGHGQTLCVGRANRINIIAELRANRINIIGGCGGWR